MGVTTRDTTYIDLGSPLPGWQLIKCVKNNGILKDQEFALIRENDYVFKWNESPMPKPNKDEDSDPMQLWTLAVNRFTLEFVSDPVSCYELSKSAITAGYDKKCSLAKWLFDYMGRYIDTYLSKIFK